MSLRYDKLNSLIQYQHQKSHYQRILHPRDIITIPQIPPNPKNKSLHHVNKAIKEQERQRKISNRKILQRLIQIRNQSGLLERVERQPQISQPNKPKKTLISSWKRTEAEREQSIENVRLVKKYENAEPSIGNVKQWNKHETFYKNIEKKMSRFTLNEMYDPTTRLIETFTVLSNKQQRRALSKMSKKHRRIMLVDQMASNTEGEKTRDLKGLKKKQKKGKQMRSEGKEGKKE